MSHVDSALEISFFEKVWQASTVVNVEMSDQDQVNILGVDDIKIGQGLDALLTRMNTAVHQYFAPFALDVDTGAADFVS